MDLFYTNQAIASLCIDRIISVIKNPSDYFWLEPSAGQGAFSEIVKSMKVQTLAFDINPRPDLYIHHQDYLNFKFNIGTSKKILVYGNPPFNSVRNFILKSCEFCDVIAFILPLSFLKPSMQKYFPINFHLISSKSLPRNCFVHDNNPYDVPCVFQIWKKKDHDRDVVPPEKPIGFSYSDKNIHDLCIVRVGHSTGKCFGYSPHKSENSHYFIKLNEQVNTQDINIIISQLNETQYEFINNTVAQKSLSKPELNHVLNLKIKNCYIENGI